MKVRSETTNNNYLPEDCVYFRNTKQSIFYIEHGAKLIDLFIDSKHQLVFVFLREEHSKMIELWMDNKGNYETNKCYMK